MVQSALPVWLWWMWGARAVQYGLRSLRAQALRVGTCAQSHQADQLTKHADLLPIRTHSLFGEGLQTIVAKATSSARTYVAMADGFVQCGLTRPRPPIPHKPWDSWKREVFPRPFMHGATSPPVRSLTHKLGLIYTITPSPGMNVSELISEKNHAS